MNIVVSSSTGRVHIATDPGRNRGWWWTACGQLLPGWQPEPEQKLAITCKRCAR